MASAALLGCPSASPQDPVDGTTQAGAPSSTPGSTTAPGGSGDASATGSGESADTVGDGAAAPAHPACADDESQIIAIPKSEAALLQAGLVKMVTVLAPNGGAIRLTAQGGVSDAQLLRARRVFEFYLSDAAGSQFGQDKSAVANALADNGATLVYFNTEADSESAQRGALQQVEGAFQDLYATESPVEGSAAYLQSTVRDATYEELFHLVQGGGIVESLPAYQQQLEDATQSALDAGVWTPPADVLAEWEAEGSLSFEYIISVIDVYYGLWEHAPAPSFYGEYQLAAREDLARMDAAGLAAVQAFLPEAVGHWVELDPSFTGTFSLALDDAQPYTLKSQHLRHVGLSGTADAGLLGNAADNTLRGNEGANGLDGGAGEDTVVYCAPRGDFEVERDGETVIVDGPAGRDVLRDVEHVHFLDRIIDL